MIGTHLRDAYESFTLAHAVLLVLHVRIIC